MRLFTELKRRNVLRMAVLYVVAAWLVMQVAGVLVDLDVLPAEVGPWVMAVLAIGFPIALVVSWFFDITPEGVVRDEDVSEAQPVLAASGRRTDFVIIAMLAAAVILLLVWEPPASADEALTVLPFESMTGAEEASFSEGVSIELLNLMAQLRRFKIKNPPQATILARFPDVSTLAEEMDVRWVLKGSVRRAEQRVRIAVQLIDADDDASIAWSNVFDRELSAENLFAIQTEIARSITSELRQTLDEPAEQRLAAPPTQSTEAYAAYLIGRQRLTDRKVDELLDAVNQFAQAIQLDSGFAGAYSGLVDACFLYGLYSGGHRDDNCPPTAAELEELARKAIELDPESGEAWVSLGMAIDEQVDASLESMPRLREALAAYERGLELNPSLSQGYHWYGNALRRVFLYPDPPKGWFEAWKAGVWESVYDQGLEVDPLSIGLHYMKGIYPLDTRSKEEAMWHAQRIVEIAPGSPRGYEKVGEQQWQLNGRIDEAIRWLAKAEEIDPQSSPPWVVGYAYSALGDPEMAVAYIEWEKSLAAPDSQSAQKGIPMRQAVIRLVAGKDGSDAVAELDALLAQTGPLWLTVFVDLALGRPDDALARIEAGAPGCVAADSTPEDYDLCPVELIRVYEEMGNQDEAEQLGDAKIALAKLWADEFPHPKSRLVHASALAATGRSDEALDVLEKLVATGWRGDYMDVLRFTLYYDVTFDAIRDHPRFQALVATIEADMAQQLENVREMQRLGEVPTFEEVRAIIAANEEGRGR